MIFETKSFPIILLTLQTSYIVFCTPRSGIIRSPDVDVCHVGRP